VNENLPCNGKKLEASYQRDAQSRMLDLVHCKKHGSFNHCNLVWCATMQICAEVYGNFT